MTLVLEPEAEDDLSEARDWYESRRGGLGFDFLREVDAALRRIVSNPQLNAPIYGDIRSTMLRRFPFSVYFVVEQGRVVVIGVLHHRRNPAVWQRRFRR